MKKIFFLFSTVVILLISATASKGQQPGTQLPQVVQVDINLEGLTGTVTRFTCEKNKLNISFRIRNKKHDACFITLISKINNTPEDPNVTSPPSAGTVEVGNKFKKYNKINCDQTVICKANIDVKDSWVAQGGNIPVSVRAE